MRGTLALYWGRWGGWSWRVYHWPQGRAVRLVLGHVAFLYMPRDLDDVLRDVLRDVLHPPAS